jgi:uncharacterized protein (TIGR02145 family)
MRKKLSFLGLIAFLFAMVTVFNYSCKKDEDIKIEADNISLVSGNQQSAFINATLVTPIVIIVKDKDGKAFKGTTVNFDVLNGSVSATTLKTDAEGKASIEWTLGSTVGQQTLTITAYKSDGKTKLSGSPIIVTANGIEKSRISSFVLIKGDKQTAEVETKLSQAIDVVLKDQNGHKMSGIDVYFDVTEGSVTKQKYTTQSTGIARTEWTLGSTVGTQTLKISVYKEDGTTHINGSPITVTATATAKVLDPGPYKLVLISGNNQTGEINSNLENKIKFKVEDETGNSIANAEVKFYITEGYIFNRQDSISVKTNSKGETSGTWRLGSTVGTQTLIVKAFKEDGTTQLINSPFTVEATATETQANSIHTTTDGGNNQIGTVDSELCMPIVVEVFDKFNKAFEGQKVFFSVDEGSVSKSEAFSDSDGKITIRWTLGSTVGTQTLTVTSFKSDGTTHLINSPFTFTATAKAKNEIGTVTDVDGNVYKTVKIGKQTWMAENLKVTHYADGTALTEVTDNTEWKNLPADNHAYCYVNNNKNTEYGIMYTRNSALRDVEGSRENPSGIQGIAPDGWHIPSEAEWNELLTDLGVYPGGKLRESGTEHWNKTDDGYNETKFSAYGAGMRLSSNGEFYNFKEEADWWATDLVNKKNAIYFQIKSKPRFRPEKPGTRNYRMGLTIRCIKDQK